MLRIGIDLGGTKTEGIVMDAEGHVLRRQRVATPGVYRECVSSLVDLALQLRAAHTAVGDMSVGIGTPGVWDPGTGRMKNCNSVWLNERPLYVDLVTELGEAVRIANDADCFALSEAWNGAAIGARVVFGVILGTGVGGGIVVEGRLLQGPTGITGEWGHTPLAYLRDDPVPDAELDAAEEQLADRACYCGRRNCVETFLSGPGLARTHTELHGQTLSAEAVAAGDDPSCALTMRLYQRMLARTLAQVINVLDPDVIVFGGGLSNIGSLYAALPALCSGYVFSDRLETAIRAPRFGDSSGALGAARLWPADYTSAHPRNA